jgi:hypothetical protein
MLGLGILRSNRCFGYASIFIAMGLNQCFSQGTSNAVCSRDDAAISKPIAEIVHEFSHVSSGQLIACQLDELLICETVAIPIKITNKLDRKYRLGTNRSTCGCTVAKIVGSNDEIVPGQSIGLEIRVSPRDAGPFSKSITFFEPDDDTPLFVLELKSNVRDPLDLPIQSVIELGKVPASKSLSFEVSANSRDVSLFADRILFVGDFVREFESNQKDDHKVTVAFRLEADSDSPFETMHHLKLNYKSRSGDVDRDFPVLVRRAVPLRATQKKITILNTSGSQSSEIKFALLGGFSANSEYKVSLLLGDDQISETTVVAHSNRVLPVKFLLNKENPIWHADAGQLRIRLGDESFEIPFSIVKD